MKYKLILFFISLLSLFIYCKSGFYKREKIYQTNHIAIYLYDEEDYPDEKEIKAHLKKVQKFPQESDKKLLLLFQNLKVEKKTFFSEDIYPLFYPEQIKELSKVFPNILPNLPDKRRILIVQKYDPFKTLMSKNKRSTFLLWYDENGYNVVFGDIHEDLLPDVFLSEEEDWLDIFPVSLKRADDNLRIIKEDYFDFKKVGDFAHYTWIAVKPEKIEPMMLAKKNMTMEKSNKKISERLEELKKLYEQKLITESEYNKKKAEILSEL